MLAWLGLVTILLVAPDIYGRRLKTSAGHRGAAATLFVLAISCLIALLSVGVVRRWRWTFWLILVAFTFGLLRVAAAVLQLSGWMAADGPTW